MDYKLRIPLNPFQTWTGSGASKKMRLWTALALLTFFLIAAGAYVGINTDLGDGWQRRHTILDLRELPLGQVKMRGVVTYVDSANKRFWLQDGTGAIAINQDPASAGVHFGDAVLLGMKKTHAFDPATGFASLGLTDFEVESSRKHASLPLPVKTTIPALSEAAKNGIRVTVGGTVHGISAKGNNVVQVDVGGDGREVQAHVPGNPRDLAQWLNATVRVTGVLEVLLDKGGSPTSEIIWTQNVTDLNKIEDAPRQSPIVSTRNLYAEMAHITAHLVRLRGRVLFQESPNRLLVEDQWGTIGCHLEKPGNFAPGTSVELAGFPNVDGLRVDLDHVTVTPISNRDVPASGRDDSPITIAGLRALSGDVLRTLPPVKVTGVVTYLNTNFRQLFLQDATAGIFLKYASTPVPLYQGEKITVIGLAKDGDFAPVIVAPKFISVGPAPLPKAQLMDSRANSGTLDSLYSEVEGVIHPIRGKLYPNQQTTFDLYTPVGPVHVGVMDHPSQDDFMADLQDATARVRGVVGEVFNSRKQLVGLQLAVQNMKGIQVIEPGSSNPFAEPAMPISSLLRFSRNARPGHMVVVLSLITLLSHGFFYIQDHTGGVRIESAAGDLHLGDVVKAAGYATATEYSPALMDAVVQAQHKVSTIPPQPVTADMLSDGSLDSELVSIDATLLSVESSAGVRTLSLTSGGQTFQAVFHPTDRGQPFIAPKEGSLLRLTGICSVQVGRGRTDNLLKKDAVDFILTLPSASDIQVLKDGNWWTLDHSLILVGILIAIVLTSLGRLLVLIYRIEGKDQELRAAKETESTVRQLIGAMQEVRDKKQFTSRVVLPEANELASLGAEFNHMIEELHLRDSAMAESEAKLQQQAFSDALTGLPNRRLLFDRLAQSIAKARRDGSRVAVLYIDLDGFKLVNDSFGHNFGDLLLKRVVERMSSRIRESDTLARLGGDEFAVILNNLKIVGHAEHLAESLLQLLSKPFTIEDQEIHIGASIGIAVFPEHAGTDSELLQFADSAMYSAKRSGKNCLVVYTDDLGESVRERSVVESQLRRAIEDGDISVHYQPEFDIESRRLIRFEALARWNHPTLGSISPTKFIPIAEESGLIIPLGAYVMERACLDCLSWQSSSTSSVEVAVNVSIVQFGRESFVEEVEAVLTKTGLPPKLLQIELTESVMLGGLENAAATIKRLQSLGVSVAVDDFGTGYSALSYIADLPFNALKIDRTFMKEIMQRSESRVLVQSLVLLAQQLGMKVIVEGIETEAQLKVVEEMGADQVQGYLLGRPTADPMAELAHQSHEMTVPVGALAL